MAEDRDMAQPQAEPVDTADKPSVKLGERNHKFMIPGYRILRVNQPQVHE